MTEESWRMTPRTTGGKWSVWLIVAMAILLLVGSNLADTLYESVAGGSTILADIGARPALALSMLAGMAAGVAAFFTGLPAILRRRERAILVVASTLVGALVILWLAAEILFPH